MKLVIHRGSHEIGGSCVEIISGKSRLVIDIGVPLVDKGGQKFNIRDYKTLSGPELVEKGILPNIAGLYKWDINSSHPDGMLISHAHIDHYGFYKHLHDDIPIYLGEASHKIMEISTIFDIVEGFVSKPAYIKSGKPFTLADFTITPYLMDHSAFDSYAFLIEADNKRIIYSGDFRAHGRKEKAFWWYLYNAPADVDVLLLEGTMFGRTTEKCQSEEEIENEIYKVIEGNNKITLICVSGQNIDRLVSIDRACQKAGKTFLVDCYVATMLKAMHSFARIPFPSKDYNEIRVFYLKGLFKKAADKGQPELMYQFKNYKMKPENISANRNKIVMIVRSTMVPYLRNIAGIEGGEFIYSMWKGYWDEGGMDQLRDFVQKTGMNYHYIHTSGHADLQTLKMTVDRLKPKMIVPIHTFHPELFNTIGNNVRILKDGEVFEL